MRLGALVVLLLTWLLAACGTQTPATSAPTAATSATSAPAAAPTADASNAGAVAGVTVRTGYVPVLIYAPLFVAMERGYFADEGLTVELLPIQGGSESVVQLAAGNFDVAVGGAGAGLFNAAARGVEFTIVAPMHSERPPLASPLVISAARADEITSVADLKGKKVAINAAGAATEYWLAQALAKGGLGMNDVEVTAVPFRDVPAALEARSIDAAILGEPLATINTDKGIVTVLSNDFIEGFASTFLYMGKPLLAEKPEAARAFMRAYLRACRDLQGDYMTDEIAQIVEKYTQVPAAVSKRASLPTYEPNGTINVEDINTLQSYFFERGLLEYQQPIDVTAFIDQRLAAEVAAELDQ
jgi:NitT/TauT family transport system substrate-binding protein